MTVRRSTAKWAIAAAVSVAMTACGSTVAGTSGSSNLATDGLSGSSAAASSNVAQQLPTAAGDGVGGPNAASGSANATDPGSSGASADSGAQMPSNTKAPVEVGAYVLKNAAGFYAALGVSSPGDEEIQVNAAVKDLNAHGGLLGHPIKPVFAYSDLASSQSGEEQEQAACATWTQDNRVIAVVTPIAITGTLMGCLASHHVPLLYASGTMLTRSELASYPLQVMPSMPVQDRMVGFWVESLWRQHYFTAKSAAQPMRLGVLHFDDPAEEPVIKGPLTRALAAHNIAISAQEALPQPTSTTSLSDDSSGCQSAILKFAAANITHVMMLDRNGNQLLLCAPAAESQNYHPRYGLSSTSAPGGVESALPADQLAGSVGVGWLPTGDVSDAHEIGVGPAAQHCLAEMAAAGEDTTSRSTDDSALRYCETLSLLQRAFDLGGAISTAGFSSGLSRVGSAFNDPMTFAVFFGSGRRDGPAAVRDFAFNSSCGCYRYVSRVISVG
jgi:hypothetical protein